MQNPIVRINLLIDRSFKNVPVRASAMNLNVQWVLQRHLTCNAVLQTKVGAGKEDGRMSVDQINELVEKEKRGIFRKLDLGLPRPWKSDDKMKKFDDRVIVKATPR